MLLEIKRYEVKFLGMPIGRGESKGNKKGDLIRSEEHSVFSDIGQTDAAQGSPTYGRRVCKVGNVYVLDQWQIQKYGAAFDVEHKKEVKSYVFDDGLLDEETEAYRVKLSRERQERAVKESEAQRKAAEKEAKEKADAAAKEHEEAMKAKEKKLKEEGKIAAEREAKEAEEGRPLRRVRRTEK